ncbi:MAG TPA: glycosyltransferase [Thermoleophilaceae bacterium]
MRTVVCLVGGGNDETAAANLRAHLPRDVDLVFDLTQVPPGDVVLVEAGCAVAPGWFELLRDAAYSDSIIATASALADHCPEAAVAERARIAAGASLRLRPRLLGATGPCVYVRRTAIELAGAPQGGMDDFSRRCAAAGLSHVLADDVLVGGGPPGALGPRRGAPATLMRSLAAVRSALDGLSVTIDCRHLTGTLTGIQVHTLELMAALARRGRFRIRALTSPLVSDEAREILAAVDGVEELDYDALGPDTPLSDIFHRPYQVTNEDDLRVSHLTGERFVVTQHDLIGYRNPAYSGSDEGWHAYRELTRRALAGADRVAFVSRHAAADALADDLVDADAIRVVPNGVDHAAVTPPEGVRPPAAPEPGFLICLGTNFRHKNRPFALALLAELRSRHGFGGGLVLAGPHMEHGSSADEEAAFMAAHPHLLDHVTDLGAVSEAEKAWLYANAAAVVYPSVYEGFGLIPFEAAAAGVPCLFAPQAALSEVLPPDTALLVPWDAAASADRCADVLREGRPRRRLVKQLRTAAEPFTWDAAAEAVQALYDETVVAPRREAGAFAREAIGLREERNRFKWELDALQAQHDALIEAIGEDGLRLVGHGGLLPNEVRASLRAVALRPRLAQRLYALIGLLSRLPRRGAG